ncbi:hypothetical protein [Dactylosporangium sp. NPDC000521]|uniref:hypothetical protein n=1 Tax=Dactylosporangium sp. NPDC000521 TaxID=3363975 RepID=UPI003696EA9C
MDPYVTATTFSNYGEVVQQVYGAAGISQLTRNYTYDSSTGRLANITSKLPNQQQPGQLASVQNDTYTYTYTYSATGDITRITDGTDNQTQCYRYDGQHRLAEAWTAMDACAANPTSSAIGASGKYPYWDSYNFDASGRRTQDIHRTSASSTTTRDYTYPAPGATAQRVHAPTAVTYTGAISRIDTMTYDSGGNTQQRTINGTVTDFTFNTENRFSGANVHAAGGDQLTSHLYDASGATLIRTDPTGKTLYAAGQEYRETGGTVTATRYYVQVGGLVAVRNSSGCFWLGTDRQGSPNLMVNTATGRHNVVGTPLMAVTVPPKAFGP